MSLRPRQIVTLLLIGLLVVLQAQLWLGRGSVGHVAELRSQLAKQKTTNQQDQQGNEQLALDVKDLKEGLSMVEDKARRELGMIKPGEIFVRYAQ